MSCYCMCTILSQTKNNERYCWVLRNLRVTNSQESLKRETSTTPFHWFLVSYKIMCMWLHEIHGHNILHSKGGTDFLVHRPQLRTGLQEIYISEVVMALLWLSGYLVSGIRSPKDQFPLNSITKVKLLYFLIQWDKFIRNVLSVNSWIHHWHIFLTRHYFSKRNKCSAGDEHMIWVGNKPEKTLSLRAGPSN